jgi:6-phosphogluconolactonase
LHAGQGIIICSDLHLSGHFLFASNRGHDSIAVFRIDGSGCLHLVHRQSCDGKTLRNFAIDPTGHHLLVGNQDSDYISVFEINEDGSLRLCSRYEAESPVCIRFLE